MRKVSYYVYPMDLKLKWKFSGDFNEHQHIELHEGHILDDKKVTFMEIITFFNFYSNQEIDNN